MKSKLMIALCVLGSCVTTWAQDDEVQALPPAPIATVTSSVAIPVAPVTPPKVKAEPTGLAEIIRAKYPLAVAYKEFGTGWREFFWEYNLYFTKGEAHWLSEHEYLVAYKFAPRDKKLLEEKEFIASATNNSYPFVADDRFELTLLPMEELIPYVTRGNTNLRSFDPSRRKNPFDASRGSNAFQQNLSLVYLRKIYSAFNAYGRAYLNVTPPLETAFAARAALLPFAENAAIFTQPGTDAPYKANPIFSNRKWAHLRGKGRWVLFYESQPAPDGMRAVLRFDGVARRVEEKTWSALKKLSQLDN
jgi:hypothetical protein